MKYDEIKDKKYNYPKIHTVFNYLEYSIIDLVYNKNFKINSFYSLKIQC